MVVDSQVVNDGGALPKPDAPDSVKNTKGYGLQAAKAMYAQNKAYLDIRNARFLNAKLYYKGKQPIAPYLSLLNVNGKQAFIDINFKPRPIAKKFVKILIGEYMGKTEKPSATSLNPLVADKKQDVIDNAKWKIIEKDFINETQKLANMQLEDPSMYTPGSVQEAEFYYSMNNKTREELILEMMIQFAHNDNNYKSFKRRILKDLILHNVGGVVDSMDNNGRLVFEAIPAEELGYGPSKKEDFSDSPYFFRYQRMLVSDFRLLPGNDMTEQEIYNVAKSFANKYGNNSVNYPFSPQYVGASIRPYDDLSIDVMKIWYRTVKNVTYSSGVDKYGRQIFDINDNLTEKTNPNKQLGQKPYQVGYTGTWVVGTDYIINWGIEQFMLKSDAHLERVEPPYSVFMIDNDGDMDSKSIVEDMISSIIEMDLDILKIQQIKAQQAPNGLMIDIEGLEDIDLGLGNGALKPLQLREIRSQSGDVYYRSKNEPGDSSQGPPIKELKGDFGNLLSELINDYNFNLSNIRDYIGVNEYRDGSTVNPKTGFNVIQSQMQSSNNATIHVYEAYIDILRRLDKHIGIRIWDSLKERGAYVNYKKILGEYNVAFVAESDSITSSLYDIDIETDLSDIEKANLEQEKQLAISNGLIDIKDLAAINLMKNYKQAAQYLAVVTAKNKSEQMKMAQANAQANIQSQQQSLQLKGQSDQAIAEINGKAQVAVVEAKVQGDVIKKQIDFYNQMRLQAFVLGKELPPQVQQEIDEFMQEQKLIQVAGVQKVLLDKADDEAQAQQEQQQAQEQQQQDPNSIQPKPLQGQ